MFRSILIYLSKAVWARRIVTGWSFAWRAASRFVAGESLDDAIKAIKELNARGIEATLDHLGEHTGDVHQSRQASQEIIAALEAIEQSKVRANVSIKLTQIGLALDEEVCAENLQTILNYAKERDNFVRIDMEDSPWVEQTLRLYHRMRVECDCQNVGVVIQAYLYRSEADVRSIVEFGGRVRLCKGAYKEPADIAFPAKKDVDHNFDLLTDLMIDGAIASGAQPISSDGRVPPILAVASHDPERLSYAKFYAQQAGLPKEALEFQMLYGIRRDLQEQTRKEGYPVRIYVPYGSEWYPYFVRRLAERPANLWFFLSNLIRR